MRTLLLINQPGHGELKQMDGAIIIIFQPLRLIMI